MEDKSSQKRSLSDEEKKRIRNFSLLIGPGQMKSYLLRYSHTFNRESSRKEHAFTYDFSELIKKIINPEVSILNTQDIDNYDLFLRSLYKYQGLNLDAPLSTMVTQPSEIENDKERKLYELYYKNVYSKIPLKEVKERQLEKSFMYRPFLYNEGLLCMINYIVGYIREQNINYDRIFFKFTDIDISGVKIDLEDPEEPSITVTNLGEKKLKEFKW